MQNNDITVMDVIPPLFMFGFERSGTTLLSMIVGAHQDIAVPLTVTGMWYRYAQELERYGQLRTHGDLERLVVDLLEEERIQLWDVELHRDDVLGGLETRDYAAVVARFHELYAVANRKPYWGNLDIATLDHMDLAYQWFPEARFIHIVRDGRDIALSHETMPYGVANTLEAAEKWRHRLTVNLKMGAILGTKNYLVVRYEDLVLDTEKVLRKLCDFIGIPFSAKMLHYPEMVSKKVPENRRWLWPALNQPPDKSKVNRWVRQMSETKRIVFEGTAHDMLGELGYETYEQIPKRLSAYVFELWCFLGRGGRFRRIAKKLGLQRESKLQREWRRSEHGQNYEQSQKEAFGSLVANGVYHTGFRHAAELESFFRTSMGCAIEYVSDTNDAAVLECGCGAGVWLDTLGEIDKPWKTVRYYGFDLTPEMVDVARQRLTGRMEPLHLKPGDVMDDASYLFGEADSGYQVVFAFDLVQQLPRKLQLEACRKMLSHVEPGGCLVVFDHERWSLHGIRMGLRKFVTRYLRIRLVPDFYCNARYPSLAGIANALSRESDVEAAVTVSEEVAKRALIVRRLPS
jgi:SAM-dependent methyltransferase